MSARPTRSANWDKASGEGSQPLTLMPGNVQPQLLGPGPRRPKKAAPAPQPQPKVVPSSSAPRCQEGRAEPARRCSGCRQTLGGNQTGT